MLVRYPDDLTAPSWRAHRHTWLDVLASTTADMVIIPAWLLIMGVAAMVML
jgi:hypothetical protein